jgi:replicative DNA helicase
VREQELIVALLGSRQNYNRFKPLLKESSLTREGKWFVDQIGAYYSKITDDTPKLEEFERFFWTTRAGHLKPGAETELYTLLFKTIAEKTYKEEIVKELLEHYISIDYCNKIHTELEGILSGSPKAKGLEVVGDMVTKYLEEVNRSVTHADLFASSDIAEIAAKVSSPGLEWRLEELNRSLGPIRKGDLIIIGGRPEVGKTTMWTSEISWMAEQLPPTSTILVINNEEESAKVQLRLMQSSLAATAGFILADLRYSEAEYLKRVHNKDKIKITRQDLNASTKELDQIIQEISPSLIVFDQLDKVVIRSSREEREDERLGRLYLWARNLAARYCPVIALSQVNATGEGQRWLTQAQLRGSNTDKAGEADAIILIGKDLSPGFEDTRFLSIAKNKLVGGPRTDPALRHGKFEVKIHPEFGRYKGSYK